MIASHCPTLRRSVVAAMLTFGLGVVAPAASAAPAPKVTICHATGSATKPYVQITVNANAVPAHETHQDREDIIPAPEVGPCVVPIIDVCPNLPGDQVTLPEGYVLELGDCVQDPAPPSETDLCPNVDGDQASVPDGQYIDLEGNCVDDVEYIECVVSGGVTQTRTTVTGTTANDTIDCTAASPGKRIDGKVGNDTITGTAYPDVIDGLDGNDTITGLAGNDLITGGNGDDTLSGSDGDDTVSGDAGADTVSGGADNDTLDGGDGIDTLNGGEGDDSLSGPSTDLDQDTLNGDAGNDACGGLLDGEIRTGCES